MVSEVDEDLRLAIRLEDLAVASSDLRCMTLDDGEEVFWGDSGSLVVDVATSIDILSVWFIEDFAWEWVLRIVCNVVVSQGDDLILWNSILFHYLIGVADISLMTIVSVTV